MERHAVTRLRRVSNPGYLSKDVNGWMNHPAFPGPEPGGSEINAAKTPLRPSSWVISSQNDGSAPLARPCSTRQRFVRSSADRKQLRRSGYTKPLSAKA